MIKKHLLCPQRLRRVPEHFSWLDHRLVRDNHLHRLSPNAMALYLFLVIVGDAQGLSYYGDKAIAKTISLRVDTVVAARRELIGAGLVAFKKPLYQVLDLAPKSETKRSGEALSISQLFQQAMAAAEVSQ